MKYSVHTSQKHTASITKSSFVEWLVR